MIKYKNTLIFFLFNLLLSCQNTANKKVEIIVENKTEVNIDSLSVTNWIDEFKINEFKKHDSVKIELGFENPHFKGDGSYAVSYYIKGVKKFKDFGYYTNGYPTNSIYTLEIYHDTLIIKEEMKKKNR